MCIHEYDTKFVRSQRSEDVVFVNVTTMNNERATRLLLSILANIQVRLWASHHCDGKLLLLVIKSQERTRTYAKPNGANDNDNKILKTTRNRNKSLT